MKTNLKDLAILEASINAKKVGDMVIGALQEILPHVRGASCVLPPKRPVIPIGKDHPLLLKETAHYWSGNAVQC